jgi:hypothetical protein
MDGFFGRCNFWSSFFFFKRFYDVLPDIESQMVILDHVSHHLESCSRKCKLRWKNRLLLFPFRTSLGFVQNWNLPIHWLLQHPPLLDTDQIGFLSIPFLIWSYSLLKLRYRLGWVTFECLENPHHMVKQIVISSKKDVDHVAHKMSEEP